MVDQRAEAASDGGGPHDFDLIEAAVMETTRGRWFLREYARRVRANETAGLLDALGRIERIVSYNQRPPEPAQESLAARVAQAHERLASVVWYLRESGFDGRVCASLQKEIAALGALVGTSEEFAPHRLLDGEVVTNALPERQVAEQAEKSVAPVIAPSPSPEPVPAQPSAAASAPASFDIDAQTRAVRAKLEQLDALPTDARLAMFA